MSLHKINPTKTKAWKKLVEQKDILTTETLNSLFAKEKNRLDYLSIKWDCFDIDFSKNLLDEKTFSFLTDLAEECKIDDSIKINDKKITYPSDHGIVVTEFKLK